MSDMTMDAQEKPSINLSSMLLELFYNGLFHPLKAYRRIGANEASINQVLFCGLLFVLLISSILPVVQLIWKGGEPAALVYSIPLSAIGGIVLWVVMSAIIAMWAYAFSGESRFKTFLALSSLSTLPWVFMGPVALFKTGLMGVGDAVGLLAGLLVWLWSAILFALAIGVAYQLTVERVLVVLIMPFVFTMVTFAWVVGFFVNLGQFAPG